MFWDVKAGMTNFLSASEFWRGGWYRHARALPSPNRNARPLGVKVRLVVIHAISLPPGQFGTGDVQRLFTNTLPWDAHPDFQAIRGLEVSAHFFITRDGALWQFVDCDERAWHAGQSRWLGASNCNDWSIGIELEGTADIAFEDPQYETLTALCAALPERYPIEAVAGHQHIAPERKWDPGPQFDWRRFQNSLGWPDRYFP